MSKKLSGAVAREYHDQRVQSLERECDKLRLNLIAQDNTIAGLKAELLALQNQNAAIRAEAESDAKQASNNWDAYTKMLDQRNREMEESARLRRLVSAIRQMAEVP